VVCTRPVVCPTHGWRSQVNSTSRLGQCYILDRGPNWVLPHGHADPLILHAESNPGSQHQPLSSKPAWGPLTTLTQSLGHSLSVPSRVTRSPGEGCSHWSWKRMSLSELVSNGRTPFLLCAGNPSDTGRMVLTCRGSREERGVRANSQHLVISV
jgi:hypothetical protein